MRRLTEIAFLSLLITGLSCKDSKKATPELFELVPNSGISFVNTITNEKDFNIFSYRNFYNGGGVAIGDINNDGLVDIFFTANMGANKLYLNKGNLQFEDVSGKAGFIDKKDWSTGVVMVDINNDGWLDIYVCNAGYIDGKPPVSQLYINNKDLTFREAAEEYGLTNTGGYTTHAAFFDYDLDGDLDVFIINNSFLPVNTLNYANKRDLRAANWPVKDFLKGGGDRFLRNDNGKFTDISAEAGIYGSLISFGLGVTVGDVNGDHYPDVYVSNDFFERDYLYINQRNGTFKDELEKWVQHTSLSSMGADMADINNDGYPDIFTTDMLPAEDDRLKTTTSFENIDVFRLKQKSGFYNQFTQNTLQVNNRNGQFLETAFFSGVSSTDWSWGGLIFDADNDGLSDIYVCNGIYKDVTDQDFIDFFADNIIQRMVLTGEKEDVDSVINRMPSTPIRNRVFKNKGNLHFIEQGNEWGFKQASFSSGAAYGDLDNDGDLDLVISNVNEKAFIYKNKTRELHPENNFITLQLKGSAGNTFAVGSQIQVHANGQLLCRELIPSRGFQSSVDYRQVIGIGAATKVDSVTIIWPGGTFDTYRDLAINQAHVLSASGKGIKFHDNAAPGTDTLLKLIPASFEKHQEDDYIDYYDERNLPELLSQEGPHIAKADVNGDGLEDVFIAGAAGQAGQLYLQTANGFIKTTQPSIQQYADFEDVAVLFFDADKDGDADLYIGAGGNNQRPESRQLQHRLFKNDGKGNFEIDTKAFPINSMNIAVAVANDFDGDGDADLFVGSRSVPYSYGITPQSYLFRNDGNGHFTDVTKELAPELVNAGMITAATWADLDGDQQPELIITGEWMHTRIFSVDKASSKFTERKKTGLDDKNGWWQSIHATDLNGDGRTDLVIGNIGQNFYLSPTATEPVYLWLNDFDQNGLAEQFMTKTIDGKNKPVFMKREITDQFPGLKKKNLRHSDYANKDIYDLFGKDIVSKSARKTFDYTQSVIALNNGDGTFSVKPMTQELQLSSINAITSTDVDGNGTPDLIMGGNMFGFPPQFSRLDASYGHVLLNDGKGNFTPASSKRSGLQLRGMIRDIQSIKNNTGGHYLLIVQNNELPVLFKTGKK